MRSRSLLCLFILLLVAASLVSAAEPVGPITAAPETASAAASSCPTAALSFLTPAPTEKSGTLCGSCSSTICQGKTVNSGCYSDPSGQIYTCQAYATCSDGVSRQCGCYRFIP